MSCWTLPETRVGQSAQVLGIVTRPILAVWCSSQFLMPLSSLCGSPQLQLHNLWYSPATYLSCHILMQLQITKSSHCWCLPATSCPLDPIPTWLLKKLTPFIVPVICYLCNLSLQSVTFPQCLKEAIVYPCIKKPHMDPEQLKSYRPVSNLCYISKILCFKKKFTPRTFMIILWNENQFK